MLTSFRSGSGAECMVGVAQLVERWLVEPDVAGSSPVVHPKMIHLQAIVVADPAALLERETEQAGAPELDPPWVTLVWNDPVNLMSYVSWVFRSYFGFPAQEATRRMLQVHEDGRAVVASGSREEMERHVEAMHDFGLWATLERDAR
ncbi:MAG: ATP-dependent Clp protease adapter ClpS [Actinomycetota bacterium]